MTRNVVPVAVFDPMDPTPTYHAYKPGLFDRTYDSQGRQDGWQRRTVCGLVATSASWLPACDSLPASHYRESDHATRLRRDHAARIGQPCRVCFPTTAKDKR